uniref:Uncharacterized protein n=1 Tax=Glossina pallidipes TaxID=7398 RepID=A0A1A9ZSP3_GLOPL
MSYRDATVTTVRISVACSLKPLASVASGLSRPSRDGANAELVAANDCSLDVYWVEEGPHYALSPGFILRKRYADASGNSSTYLMKASGCLLPVKLSSYLLTTSMRRLVPEYKSLKDLMKKRETWNT